MQDDILPGLVHAHCSVFAMYMTLATSSGNGGQCDLVTRPADIML